MILSRESPELPEVASDLDADRAVLWTDSENPIHLPDADTCVVVKRGLDGAWETTAGVQFDGKAVCQDCARALVEPDAGVR